MKVEFIDKWGNDLRVANVARVSFGKWKEEMDDSDARLINYLSSHEHMSPFRHVGLSVRCQAPIFISRQAQKHCIGLAWNEESRRYIDTPPEFYHPNSWRSRPTGSIKQGSSGINPESSIWMKHYENLLENCLDHYNGMIGDGIAPEQARMVLPQSMMVSWVWTGSLEAFHHLCELRLAKDAQQEWVELAQPIADLCKAHFPVCWDALTKET